MARGAVVEGAYTPAVPQLIAVNLDVDAAPALSLKEIGGEAPVGWGLAWYPDSGQGAVTFKGPMAFGASDETRADWERIEERYRYMRRQRSTTFIGSFRAPEDRGRRDLDPFVRSYAGRDWVMAFDGDPGPELVRRLPIEGLPLLEPVGAPREHPLAWVVSRLLAEGARHIGSFGALRLRDLLWELDGHDVGNVLLTDGETLAVYAARESEQEMGWSRHHPPLPPPPVETPDLMLVFDSALDRQRTIMCAGTSPATCTWNALPPGELLLIRRGAVMETVTPAAGATPRRRHRMPVQATGERVLSVLHETTFAYADPVERSSHRFRLEPCHDRTQEVLEHEITVSVQARRSRFEDVFGNVTAAVEIERPYSELTVRSRSVVRVRTGPDPRESNGHAPRLPLVWMPWQRQMLLPYLLPPELPETQLTELIAYANAFARRNDGSVLGALWDANETIHDEYEYVSGSTGLETTPFEVYVSRRGVCQDFANLLICMARLLGVPARYRVGYIRTGADYANQVQSDASHAWCELYLPWLGWVGMDPTNGCAAGLDHIRVACGRNFRDATPTEGTIWQGGGGERLGVRVQVVPVEDATPGDAPAAAPR